MADLCKTCGHEKKPEWRKTRMKPAMVCGHCKRQKKLERLERQGHKPYVRPEYSVQVPGKVCRGCGSPDLAAVRHRDGTVSAYPRCVQCRRAGQLAVRALAKANKIAREARHLASIKQPGGV